MKNKISQLKNKKLKSQTFLKVRYKMSQLKNKRTKFIYLRKQKNEKYILQPLNKNVFYGLQKEVFFHV